MSDPYGWQHLRNMRQDPNRFFRTLHGEQGDVVRFPLGTHTCWSFAHPQAVHQVLVGDWRLFHKTTRFRQIHARALGSGLLLVDGDEWVRQRQQLQPIFGPGTPIPDSLPAHAGWKARLTRWAQQGQVDLDRELREGWLEQLLWPLAGIDPAPWITPLRQILHTLRQTLLNQLFQVLLPPRWWPFWGTRQERQAVRAFRHITSEIWTQAVPGSLYHQLREPTGHGPQNAQRGLDQARMLLFNGYETMACGLTWSLWQLARHPQWQAQILAGTAPSPASTSQASPAHPSPIVSACWHETLRLYPPAYLLSREATAAVEVAGHRLSPGDQVFLFLPLLHRDPRWFEAADAFHPERFLPSANNSAASAPFLPFGLGPRHCAGESWADTLAGRMLHTAVAQCELTLPPDTPDPTPCWGLSLAPRPPVPIRVAPRRAH